MNALLSACMRLYDMAFPGEPEAFTRAMFDRYAPEYLRTICENGEPISMLFSIPYPIITANGTLDGYRQLRAECIPSGVTALLFHRKLL